MKLNNRLSVLAAEIQAAHAAIIRTSHDLAERALAAGRMLNEAKAALPHGQWDTWLREHAFLSSRTARRYMQIARAGLETATVADLGIAGAARSLAKATAQHLDNNPAYCAWRDEMLRGFARAPSAAAQHFMLATLRGSEAKQ